jgi:hypothetical protein
MKAQDNKCNLGGGIKSVCLVSEEDYKTAMENGTIEELFKNSLKVSESDFSNSINNIGVSVPYQPTFTIKL